MLHRTSKQLGADNSTVIAIMNNLNHRDYARTNANFLGKQDISTVVRNNSFLTKSDLNWFVEVAPCTWLKKIRVIVVHDTDCENLITSYYKPSQIFGIHIPKKYNGSKHAILARIALTIQSIRDYGTIPKNLPKHYVKEYREIWKCVSVPVLVNY